MAIWIPTSTTAISNSPSSNAWWNTLNIQWYTTTSTTTNYILPTFSNGTNALTWQSWVQQPPTIWSYDPQWVNMNTHYEETAEQMAARVAREAAEAEIRERERVAARARMEVREREVRDANQLAESLLLACLSPEQARTHLEQGYIDVIGSRGHRFRIQTAVRWDGRSWRGGTQSGNVLLLDAEGRTQAKYCVHPPDYLPHADAWLAQKLALEADEDTVLAVANLPWRAPEHRDIRGAARDRLRLVRDAA